MTGWAQSEARLLSNPAEVQPKKSASRNGEELSVSLEVGYAYNKIFNP